ncbi:hypothetical protein RHSIM_RhsimUnG0193600 [Rhododendron simsii]|uniref:Plastocyanin-like domain-containing protein n=1 Tax=Rhododendron simsii TaxID=118357 RepID=A0A834FTU4_RHOSS|nr:hypothetical protein RHSIM_RhsimUnG0193600 [Rhododendron simsii]
MNANNSETHPWHLHGHDFWVMGYGQGKFDINSDPKKYNLVNPIMKNTVSVQPYGWTALRFVADNPGVWAFHCHIEAHFYMGMGVVFEEGVEKLGRYPTSITGCGDTKGYPRYKDDRRRSINDEDSGFSAQGDGERRFRHDAWLPRRGKEKRAVVKAEERMNLVHKREAVVEGFAEASIASVLLRGDPDRGGHTASRVIDGDRSNRT